MYKKQKQLETEQEEMTNVTKMVKVHNGNQSIYNSKSIPSTQDVLTWTKKTSKPKT